MFRKLYSAALGAAGLAMMSTGAQAVPANQVFLDAGLGPSVGWTAVAPGSFGTGGNGFFAGGGDATFALHLATFGNTFGTSDNGHGNRAAIFDTSIDAIGTTKTFAAPFSPFLFFFQDSQIIFDQRIYSDNFTEFDPLNELNMFIYRQGDTFAFFFDDGGPIIGDDNDANDMVVTVTAAVPEPMSIALFGAGLAGLALMRRRKTTMA